MVEKIEEKIEIIIMDYLEKKDKTRLNQEELKEIREKIYKKTKKYKNYPYEKVKKWVLNAKRKLKKKNQEKKEIEIQEMEKKKKKIIPIVSNVFVQKQVEPIKSNVVDIQIQNLIYEISSVKKIMENINRKLEKIEKEIAERNE